MPLVSLLWVSKSVWSFCPNSLEANPKIACCWAKENPPPPREWGRSIAKDLATCICGGNVGPKYLLSGLPACSAFPLGSLELPLCFSGTQQGELALLIYVLTSTTSNGLPLLCYVECITLMAFTFQKVGEGCFPLTSSSSDILLQISL